MMVVVVESQSSQSQGIAEEIPHDSVLGLMFTLHYKVRSGMLTNNCTMFRKFATPQILKQSVSISSNIKKKHSGFRCE